jgi:hypothetical protein
VIGCIKPIPNTGPRAALGVFWGGLALDHPRASSNRENTVVKQLGVVTKILAKSYIPKLGFARMTAGDVVYGSRPPTWVAWVYSPYGWHRELIK